MDASIIVHGTIKILQIVIMNIIFETQLNDFHSSYITYDLLDRVIINGLIPTKYKIEFLDVVTKYTLDSKTLIIELELSYNKQQTSPKEYHKLVLTKYGTKNDIKPLYEYDTHSDEIHFIDLGSFYKGSKIQFDKKVYYEYTTSVFGDEISIPNKEFFDFLVNKYNIKSESNCEEDIQEAVYTIAKDRNKICSDFIEFLLPNIKWINLTVVNIGGNGTDRVQLRFCYNKNINSKKKYILIKKGVYVTKLSLPELSGKYNIIDTKQTSSDFYILLESID